MITAHHIHPPSCLPLALGDARLCPPRIVIMAVDRVRHRSRAPFRNASLARRSRYRAPHPVRATSSSFQRAAVVVEAPEASTEEHR